MQFLFLALLSLATFNLAFAQEGVEVNETFQGSTPNQDYLLRLQLNISEAMIPNYLVGVIYNSPLEQGISAQAILNLYRANTVNLTTTQNILQLLNISQTQVFSINGLNYTLDTFNWTFTNFYNIVTSRLNVTGVPLRNALLALQIDVTRFSEGITWGEPDPWQEFTKGNFTQANVELACAEAGITLEVLWAGIRDLFISDLITFEIKDLIQLLLSHNINQQQALVIWNAVPVTLEHVYSLALFSNVIRNFTARINNQTALGVLTSLREAIVHRSNYEVFRAERQYLDIQAQTLLTRTLLPVGSVNETAYRNLVVLTHESALSDNLTLIEIADNNYNLTNCSYVTFQNNNILTVNVASAIFFNETYVIPRSVIQNVISGSALVCNNTVFGLVRGVVGESIIADAFSNYVAPPTPSFAVKIPTNSALGLIALIIIKLFNVPI